VKAEQFTAAYFGTAVRAGGYTRRPSLDARGTVRNSPLVWIALDEHGVRLPAAPKVAVSANFAVDKASATTTATTSANALPTITSNGKPSRNETITLTEHNSGKSVAIDMTIPGPATDLSISFVQELGNFRVGTPVHLVPHMADAAGNRVYIERLPWTARRVENEKGAPVDEDATAQLSRETSWVPQKFFWESHHQMLSAMQPEQAGVYEVSFIADGLACTTKVTFTDKGKVLDVPVEPGGIQWTGDTEAAIARAKKENTWIMAYVEAQW
jgi:hypothetical protein